MTLFDPNRNGGAEVRESVDEMLANLSDRAAISVKSL
jgi:hypothetical protein